MFKLSNYYYKQQDLFKKAVQNILPLTAMFELTYKCNLRCRHCYVVPDMHNGLRDGGLRRELDTRQVFNILDQLAEAGCLNIGFTGGEPFVREDIIDILEYARKKAFNIIVFTNGTLITPQMANILKGLNINKVDISFHTTHKDTFDWLTKVKGTYKKVLRSVRLLKERGVDIYLKTTAMTINRDDLINIKHLAKKIGVHFRWGLEITPGWHGKKENLKFRLKSEEIFELQKNMQENAEIEYDKLDILKKKDIELGIALKNRMRKRYRIDHQRLFRCGAGRSEMVINPYGEMRICFDILSPAYQILKGNLNEGWRILSDYVKSASPGSNYRCHRCKLAPYCNTCPARRWLECGDLSTCSPYHKKMAKLTKREADKKSRENMRRFVNFSAVV